MVNTERWTVLSRQTLFLSLAVMPFTNLHIMSYPLPHLTLIVCVVFFFMALLTNSPVEKGGERLPLRCLSPRWPFVLFVASALLSLIVAGLEPYPPAMQFKGFVYLVKPISLCFIAILVIVPCLIRTRQHLYQACLWLFAGYIGVIVLGILGFFQKHHVSAGRLEHSIDQQFLRFQSIPFEWGAFTPLYPNRNILGEILLPGCVFIWFLYRMSGRRIYLTLYVPIALIILGTQSRSTYLAALLLICAAMMLRLGVKLPQRTAARFQRWILMKHCPKQPLTIVLALIFSFMAYSLILSRLDPLWWGGQQTSRFFPDSEMSERLARKERDARDELERRKHMATLLQQKNKDELLKSSRNMAKTVRLDWMAYGNRLLQLRISLKNLTDTASLANMIFGKGLRTFQFHLNSTPQFTKRFGHCREFGEQIDAHGWLTKVAIEQGWTGVLAMVAIFGLCIMLFLRGFSVNENDGDKDLMSFFCLIPLTNLAFFLSTTNYYQPVIWFPLGLAWLALSAGTIGTDKYSTLS